MPDMLTCSKCGASVAIVDGKEKSHNTNCFMDLCVQADRQPEPPVNVRIIVFGEDTARPVDTHFVGYDDEGIAQWQFEIPKSLAVIDLHADELPARTSIIAKRV